MLQTVHLLCGVPGSGKTWIARKFENKFTYVPHDRYEVAAYKTAVLSAARVSSKPVLAECPFRMSILKAELEQMGIRVVWYFIRESEETIAMRYALRTGEAIPKQHLSNYRRLLNDPRSWFVGSQNEIMAMLKSV